MHVIFLVSIIERTMLTRNSKLYTYKVISSQNLRKKQTILMPSLHPSVPQSQIVALYSLWQLLLRMKIYHIFDLKINIFLR